MKIVNSIRLRWAIRSNIILVCVAILFPLCVDAAFENIGLAARPMGMGGAYAALASDTNAMIWNPAGLAKLREPEIGLNYLELYGLVNYGLLAWAHPLQNSRAIGASLLSSSDPDGLYQELVIDLSAALTILENLSAGLNLKYLSSSASMGEISVGSGSGGAVDLGIRYISTDQRITLGLALPNLLSHVLYSREELKNADATSYSERLVRASRLGIALRLDLISPRFSGFIFAAEFANGHPIFGVEYTVYNASLRFGWRLTEGVSRGLTAGLGYRLGDLQFDYGFVGGRYHAQTSLFSVTLYY